MAQQQSTTTNEFDGVAIYLPTTNPAELFESVPTDYTYDQVASRDNYDRLLCESVAARFPGAVVTTSAHSAYHNLSAHSAYHNLVDAGDAALADRVCDALNDAVANAVDAVCADGGEAWMVVIGANTPDGLEIETDNGTYLIWQADDDIESSEGDVEAGQWLYQPAGYSGDLYSPAYETQDDAIAAAHTDAYQRVAERDAE